MIQVLAASALLALGILDASLRAEPVLGFRDHLLDGRPCAYCPKMRRLPTGQFFMGSSPGEGHDCELGSTGGPFLVDMNANLAVGVAEVSVAEFTAFTQANPALKPNTFCAGMIDGHFDSSSDLSWYAPGFEQAEDHPVVCISWQTAHEYTRWLSRITGKRYRLLSEAEWEYMARAGSSLRYWWGDSMAQGLANCLETACNDGYEQTAPADAFEPNRWGFANTSGNVWEWVEDCYAHDAYVVYGADYPASIPATEGCAHVLRGGSWQDGAFGLRAANRQSWRSGVALNDVGFRVAREGAELPGTLVQLH